MKVIDLLNKIANGEEVPKKIKYSNIIWYYYEIEKTYYMNNTQIELFYIENLSKKLNDEVEIIEEEKKIPEKLIKLNNVSNSSDLTALSQMQWENNKLIENKINEIIDYLKSKGE